jgi:3-deoxy-7-phosphoheptulonate synthase
VLNQTPTDNLRIVYTEEVIAPVDLMQKLPVSSVAEQTIVDARKGLHDILHANDDRLIIICGPCSIHDTEAAKEYAQRLLALRELYASQLHIIRRVFFANPRTPIGWNGLFNDPDLNDSFQINKGLHTARGLLLDLNNMGMPCGTEFLDLISPQHYADLVSWGAIGARTTESQSHRELASGLSCPVGFKNGTNGNIQIAADAIRSSSKPHHFLSITKQGHTAQFGTSGNDDCHLILRGGTKPNYDTHSVKETCNLLETQGVRPMVMIDMSHANSEKQHVRQIKVGEDIAAQIAAGEKKIIGVMIESNLVQGRQDLIADTPLVYGQSITDACVDFEQTEKIVSQLARAIDQRRA